MAGVEVVEGTCTEGWLEMVRVVVWGARRQQDRRLLYTGRVEEGQVGINQEGTAHKE